MNNNISKKSFLQALFSIKCQSTLQMLNFILYKSTQHQQIFVSQRVLGSVAHVRREAANIHMRELHELGIVQKTYREWTSCIYKINPLFYILADELKHILPALKIICRKRLLSAFMCAFFVNRTPILEEEDYVNNPCITMLEKRGKSHSGLIRESMTGVKNRFLPRKEEKIPTKGRGSSMEPSKVVISPILQRITEALCLSKAGQFKLMVFPERALQATLQEYGRRRGIKDPFFWFLMHAKGYCIQNKLHVDWDLYHILCKKYNIASNASFVVQRTPVKHAAYQAPPVTINFEDEYPKVYDAILQGKIPAGFEMTYAGFEEWLHRQTPEKMLVLTNYISQRGKHAALRDQR